MRLEEILEFLSIATTEDLILNFAILIAKIAVIICIIYTTIYLKNIYKLLQQELAITNRYLAHLDHNNYNNHNNYNEYERR